LQKKKTSKRIKIENLKISVRELTKEDIKSRNLPNQTSGLVITKIENDSPLKIQLKLIVLF
jgi:serine protease Do